MSLKPIVLQFVFDSFESLPHQPGDMTYSDTKDDGVGHSWLMRVYPGGECGDRDENGDAPIDVYLFLSTPGVKVETKVSFSIRTAIGSLHKHYRLGNHHFVGGEDTSGWGTDKITRATILDKENNILRNRALVIDVEIQLVDKKRKFVPSNPALENMQKLFGNDEQADVKFKVKGTTISAHKLILSMNAPQLAEFCGKKKTVTINNIGLDVFRIILQYVYGGEGPNEEVIKSKGRQIIEAADRYEIIGLKMAVESSLVAQRILHLGNVADWLIFADSKTCPLLKEYCLAYVASRANVVLALKSFKVVKESPELMEELVLAVSRHQPQSDDIFTETSEVPVDELRAKLKERGLDVDGSKEMLLSRLAASEDADVDGTEVTP